MSTQETLEELRLSKAFSQQDLGDQGTISRIERGLHRASNGTVRRIASVLDVPVERVAAACRESYVRGRVAGDVSAAHTQGSTTGGAL